MDAKLVGFIDSGFLVKAGAKAIQVSLNDLDINSSGVVSWLSQCARRMESRLLRAYWYDGIADPKSALYHEQRKTFDKIESNSAIQVRLGHREERPQPWRTAVIQALKDAGLDVKEFKKHFQYGKEYVQKGVDTLMVLDLVRLAQTNSYDIAVLVAGDRDLAQAVRTVQDQGKIVIIAAPEGAGVSPELKMLADEILTLNGLILKNMLAPERLDPSE